MFRNTFINKIIAYSEQPAIVSRSKTYTYKQLIQLTAVYVDFLKQNDISSGMTVILKADYSFESIALFLGLLENANIVIPITTNNEKECEDRINESSCDFVISIDENKQLVINAVGNNEKPRHELVSVLVEKRVAGLILFSSGSTGRPKAMIHDLDALSASYLERKGKAMSFLVFLMFDHIGGLNTLFNCLAMGAAIVIPQERKPEVICELIEKYKIAVLPASPTFLNLLLISKEYENYDLASLKMITYGTEPMPESLLNNLREVFSNVRFMQTFGTSETGIIRTQSKSSGSLFIKLDDPNQEFKVVDNELWLRSKTQILGYLNHSNESFTEDGWFKTGDIVEESEDGFVKIVGRAKEIINVGGEKVLPIEIENVIRQISGVRDCIVYGRKNAITGQMVVANVSIEENCDPGDIKGKIKAICKGSLEKYKIPAKIEIVGQVSFNDRFKKNRNIEM